MGDEGQSGQVFEKVWSAWRRRKWLAMLVFVAPFVAFLSFATFSPNVYQSTATILVDRQQVPEEFVRPTVTSGLDVRLQTISQEILSRARLEALIARFGLYPDLRRRVGLEPVIEQMRRDIGFDVKGGDQPNRPTTIAFMISYRGGDPQTVAQVANTLASQYVEENLKTRERQASGTAEFLRVQLDQVKGRLDVQERRVSDFKKQYVGALPQELEVNLATLERLNAQLRLNNDSQTRALERREAILRQLADSGLAAPVGANGIPGAPDPLTVRIARLRQELTELRTRFSDKYPDVVRVKAEIAELERQYAEAKDTNRKPEENEIAAPVDPQLLRMRQSLGEVEADIKVLKAEEGRLRTTIATYQQRVVETPRREQEYKELARDYDSTRELYASLLKRYAESQIAESMEQRQKGEQFRILDPALAPQAPVAPNRPRLFLVGLGLALALAVGAVVLAEQWDPTFHTADELRAFTNVPLLARIPNIVTTEDRLRRRRRFQMAVVGAALGLVVIVGAVYLIVHGDQQFLWLLSGRRS